MKTPAENPLAKAVAELLAPGGPMARVKKGFVHSPKQTDLACAYAAGIGGPDPVAAGRIGAIEAATGMGKTIAYLSVLMLDAAMTGEKVMLSTRTRALQRQIAEEDGPVVQRAVEIQTGKDIGPPCLRIGRGNYLDSARVRKAAEDLRRENPAAGEIRELENIARLVDSGAATFDALQQDFGILPPSGISPDILRLTAASSKAAAERYNRDLQAAGDSNVIVVNHALALMDARARGGLFVDDAKRMAALFDEADSLPDQARSMADEQIAMETLNQLAREIPDEHTGQIRPALAELARRVAEQLKNGPAVAKPEGQLPELAENAADAINDAAKLLPLLFSELRDELRAAARLLKRWAKATRDQNPNFAATISPAPTRAHPAFSLCAAAPAFVLSRLWAAQDDEPPLLRAVVFTSATLSQSGDTGHQYRPDQFLNSVNAPRGEINHNAVAAFAPEQFGEMEFVLADRDAPPPNSAPQNDDEHLHQPINPEFVQFIAAGIQKAREEGGRVLVLTPSFDLTETLGEQIPDVTCHRRGESVAPLLDDFRKNPAAVLITPSAWEGVNLPGLVRHLVIPRIPFRPPQDARLAALREKFRVAGKNIESAERILAAENHSATVRKLRQGIGRGIRQENDFCKLWLLDPRFPLPGKLVQNQRNRLHQGRAKNNGHFVAAVPSRFRQFSGNAFDRAQILNADGQFRPLAQRR